MTDANKVSNPTVNNTKVDLSKLKIKETLERLDTELETPEPAPVETLQESQMYQHYKCSRQSSRMITSKGKRIAFANFELYTQDEDIIEYLDAEIKQNKLLGITKGALMTVEDKDPMAALKRKHFEEFKIQQAKDASDKALGKTKDMGNTKVAGMPQINPSHSGNVAN